MREDVYQGLVRLFESTVGNLVSVDGKNMHGIVIQDVAVDGERLK